MNKYELLEEKLYKVVKRLDELKIQDKKTAEYLIQYKEYVNRLICAVKERNINDSNGALLGLIRGISDYDELCNDDVLRIIVQEADLFYSNECDEF